MTFTDQFTRFDFPLMGLVRLPRVEIAPELRARMGVAVDATNTTFFKQIVWNGYQRLKGEGQFAGIDNDTVVKRLQQEFAVFTQTGIIDYLLTVYDFTQWCDDHDIPRGPGRGSVTGSLSCYCAGIVRVNALKHKLNFTRFISEARAKPKIIDGVLYAAGKSLCDIDLDISFSQREKALRYLEEKYVGRTAKICNRLELTGKMALKDTLKVYLGYSDSEAMAVTNNIEAIFGKVESLTEAFDRHQELRDWIKRDPRHEKAFQIAQQLSGLAVTKGVHASGIFLGYYPLDGSVPIELSKTKEKVTSFDMDVVAEIGVKLDCLALKTVDVIHDTCRMLGMREQDIDLNHPSIYQYLSSTDRYYGAFQIEDGVTKEVVHKLGPRHLDDLAACLAIGRPGSLKYKDVLIEYVKTGKRKIVYPPIDDILEPTGGIIIYQESINDICQQVYKMDAISADEVRRCVTKDTRFVSKSRGWITIEKLLKDGYKDDLFLVMDRSGKQQWKPIKDIWSNGTKVARYVKLSNGMSVKATRWHQFLTAKGWKAKEKLELDDYVVCAKQVNYDGKDRLSLDMAIIIAGMLTEGCITHDLRTATFVNWDKEIMDRFVSACEREFGKNGFSTSPDYRVARLKKAVKDTLSRLMSFGKSRTKYIPDDMMGMTYETTRAFLAFMFDCEGTVTEETLEFTSASIKMAQQVQLLLLRFGIRSNLYAKYNKEYERDYYIVDIGQHADVKTFNDILASYMCSVKRQLVNANAARKVVQNYTRDIVPASIVQEFIWQYGHVFSYTSGRNYTDNISFRKFKEYAEKSGDKMWIDFANGCQEFSQVRSTDDLYDREAEVFDFTVDEDTPYIIANGMVIHNCIGKKIKEDMAKWEPVLYQKGRENKIPDTVTKYFWDTCNASADYLFSKNHCYAYTYITAQTVYLKANHPREFMLTLLRMARHEAATQECIATIARECKEMGIKVLPPDIIRSGSDFEIDKEFDGLRFGLSQMRGVSDVTMGKLTSFKRDFEDKFALFEAAKAAKINISVMCGLIYSGCLDSVIVDGSSRAKMALECQLYGLLTANEKLLAKRYAHEYQWDLTALIKGIAEKKNEKGKPLIKETRLATLRRDYADYYAMYESNSKNEELSAYLFEKHFLGYAHSSTLYSIYSKRIAGLIRLKEIVDLGAAGGGSNETFRTVAFVVEGESRISAKGAPYWKSTVSDDEATFLIMLHGSERTESCKGYNGDMPKAGDIVTITGSLSKDGKLIFAESVVIQENPMKLKKSDVQPEI